MSLYTARLNAHNLMTSLDANSLPYEGSLSASRVQDVHVYDGKNETTYATYDGTALRRQVGAVEVDTTIRWRLRAYGFKAIVSGGEGGTPIEVKDIILERRGKKRDVSGAKAEKAAARALGRATATLARAAFR